MAFLSLLFVSLGYGCLSRIRASLLIVRAVTLESFYSRYERYTHDLALYSPHEQAIFVGAVVPQDQGSIVQLIKHLILCLARAGSDDQHPGVRYARLLNGLLGVFSRGLDGVQSRVSSPKWRQRRELPRAVDEDASMSTMSSEGPVALARTSTVSDVASTSRRPSVQIIAPKKMAAVVEHKIEERVIDLSSESPTHPAAPVHSMPVMEHFNATNNGGYYVHIHNGMAHGTHNTDQTTTHSYADTSYTSVAANEAPHTAPHTHPQHMYATPVATPGATAYGPHPPPGYVHYQQQQQQHASPPFQFDLNWPPVEVDGLTHLLSDEHSLDGDFWISLPNHAQWQTSWPVGPPGAAGGAQMQSIPMNGRHGM